MAPEARQALEDAVFDAYPTLDMDTIESMPDAELRYLLGKTEPELIHHSKAKEPKLSVPKSTVERVTPRTIADAFAVVDGRLMRREVTRRTVAGFDASESVRLLPVGERVLFDGRTYRASHVLHYLRTGQWVLRISKTPKRTRYKAQVRVGAKVVHLGYFDNVADRDAAVFAYKLGIR